MEVRSGVLVLVHRFDFNRNHRQLRARAGNQHLHLVLEAFARHIQHERQIRHAEGAKPRLRVRQIHAVEQAENRARDFVAVARFWRNVVEVEVAAAQVQGALALRQHLCQMPAVFDCVLTVRISGDDAARRREMRLNVRIASLERAALAAV